MIHPPHAYPEHQRRDVSGVCIACRLWPCCCEFMMIPDYVRTARGVKCQRCRRVECGCHGSECPCGCRQDVKDLLDNSHGSGPIVNVVWCSACSDLSGFEPGDWCKLCGREVG